MATRETSYDRLRADTERREEEVKVAVARKEAVTTEAIASLASAGIIIPKAAKNITIGDVENLRQDRIYATRKTTITANYIVEKIPVPSVNNITTLFSTVPNFFNKPKLLSVATQAGEDEEIVYITTMNNYLIGSGGGVSLNVGGDISASYVIVIKDVTNDEYYDWNTTEFSVGYKEKSGEVTRKSLYPDADSGDGLFGNSDELDVIIPSQIVETTYNLFFIPTGSTAYDNNLPTEANPWVINQLPEVTTTFKFIDTPGFEYDQTTTITHSPEADLSNGANDGKTTITITTIAKRGTLSLINNKTINPRVFSDEFSGNTTFTAVDLIASVDGLVGTITGTVTINKAAIRDEDLTFAPTTFFIIT